MKTTINADLTSATVNDDETLEFLLPSYNPETLQTFTSESEVLAFVDVIAKNPNVWIVKLSDEEKEAIAYESKANEVRAERDQLLVASDWTQVLDAPVNQEAWAEYRQALRDIPQQDGFPWDVEFPAKP
jgi:hypothetical protein